MTRTAFGPMPASARMPPLWAQPLVAVLLTVAPLAPTFLIAGVGVAAVAAASGGSAESAFTDWRVALGILVTFALTIIAGVLFWVSRAERRPLATIGLRGRLGGREARWLLLGLVWAAAVAMLFALIPGGETAPQLTAANTAALAWLPLFAALLLLLAFLEEVLFRGWLLSVLTHRADAVVAMTVSGVVFASLHVLPWELAHPAKAMSFLGYAAMGAGLCALALHAGQLWTPTAFHLGYNTVFAALFLAQPDASPEALWRMLESEPRGLTSLPEAAAWLAFNLMLAAGFVRLWRRGRPPVALLAAQGAAPGRDPAN